MDLHFSEPGGVVGAFAERYSGGYAVLTSHRIIWVDASASSLPGRSCSIPLTCVKEASLWASRVFAAPKLCLQILCNARGCPTEGGIQPEQVREVLKELLQGLLSSSELQRAWDLKFLALQVKLSSRHPLTQLSDEVHHAISSRARGIASWQTGEVASTSAQVRIATN